MNSRQEFCHGGWDDPTSSGLNNTTMDVRASIFNGPFLRTPTTFRLWVFRALKLAALLISLLFLDSPQAYGFALLGPYTPWMTRELGYRYDGDIGGPMLIGEGYRWNVPEITYGFDQSFLDFFGEKGVEEVEKAIQILNDLPPASQVNVTNYPLGAMRPNYRAGAAGLIDLKSVALGMLLEQCGLASPTRYAWTVRSWDSSICDAFSQAGLSVISESSLSFLIPSFTNFVQQRNYDPWTLMPSRYVNNASYTFLVEQSVPDCSSAVAFPLLIDLSGAAAYDTVADWDAFSGVPQSPGRFYSSLSQDDAGGIRYLLSTNNTALEGLLPDVHGFGSNSENYVNQAIRPGVDKINFKKMDFDINSNRFVSYTNHYLDTFFTNGTLRHQMMARITEQPDILFTANYHGIRYTTRTSATNWIKYGGPLKDGPGVIQPPVVLNFEPHRLFCAWPGQTYGSASPDYLPLWGSFDATTNAPVAYSGDPSATHRTNFHFWLQYAVAASQVSLREFNWTLTDSSKSLISIQTSTNLSNWEPIGVIANTGGDITFFHNADRSTPARYFRIVPQ